MGVKRVYPPDPPARLRRIRQGTRRLLSRARPGRLFCSGKQSFLKRGNPKKKPSFSLQTYAPSRKFRSLFRKKKASFSLQTYAPSEKKGPNGPRRPIKSLKTVKNREPTEHTSLTKSKFSSPIQVPDSQKKTIVFTADR